jgi:hypothetical protein
MIRIQLEQGWRKKLHGLDTAMEICDEDGNVIGQFTPSEEYRLQEARRQLLAVTDEEWERIRNEPGEYSTEEVIRQLENS